MEPLADSSDLAARLGVTFTDAELTRAEALLMDASAVVRNYTRQDITEGTDTAVLETTAEQWLYLPQRPVQSVASVVVAGVALTSPYYWTLENDALYRQFGWDRQFYGALQQPWNRPNTVAVTYTHGYSAVPDDIVRIVCKLAQRSWINPEGYRSATTGGISVTLATETIGTGGLDDDDKRVLDFYRRPRRSVSLAARLM